ncbi:hypothetical protein BLGI_4852 [Brevibacillus laterosporus GI-9]|nr:hypothetical protein BLGI_4852 [Brevibacillus laterosporus GI-9]
MIATGSSLVIVRASLKVTFILALTALLLAIPAGKPDRLPKLPKN